MDVQLIYVIWPLTFIVTRYLPPYTPHVGPLDPVTFKEAARFTCVRVHWTHEWRNASLFFTPFYATRVSFGPSNIQRSRASLLDNIIRVHYTQSRWDLTTQKVRVSNENHEKSNIVISWFITLCNERKTVCWGIERGYIIQMAIIN